MPRQECKEKVQYSMSILGLVLSLAVKAVKESFGEEGLKKLRETFRQAGVELGKRETERLKLKNKDAKAYHQVVSEALKAFDVKHEVVELSETSYILRIYDCPHAKNFSSPEVCDVFVELDKGVVEGLNPELKFELTNHIKRGAPYCEYVVKLRG